MRVELPEGYVPPEPTHPLYGYLTPEEQSEYEAAERARLGIVPGAAPGELEESEEAEAPTGSSWAPPPPPLAPGGKNAAELGPSLPPLEAEEAEEATVAHTAWVPSPPPEATTVEPATMGAVGDYRWDSYKQEWVLAASPSPDAIAEPPPDVATAAGGRGASSSWTSTDGHRFRWDARAQRWITEPPESPGEPAR
ncbi:MAG: hypothetical protein ABJA74_05035 [Lapillicoccus sp.]